jgi:predicted dehydrogenase
MPTAPRPLRVGLIGSGFMGKCHALAWNAVAATFGEAPRPELVGLAEIDAGLAAARAAQFGFARATADWRDLVADPRIDVVSIAAPNALHAEMAIAALAAGKHVWCEKPMATRLADAEAMAEAAAAAPQAIAALGYNYIQNPAIRLAGELIAAGRLGPVSHFRIEMDEDFMADPAAPFGLKDSAESGYGALDDFGVHPLSLVHVLLGRSIGPARRVFAHLSRPFSERPLPGGGRRPVETHDVATLLLAFDGDCAGTLCLSRAAQGRKGRIAIQIFGAAGSLAYDQERLNELQLYEARGPAAERGFRTILASPDHPPYGHFLPAPGHGLGFNDLKIIECREFMRAIAGVPARLIGFAEGIAFERLIHAAAQSHETGRWQDIA